MGGRSGLAALAGALLAAGAAPAAAAQVEGAVVISWHGDPARCAAAGLCGVSGSVAYWPEGAPTPYTMDGRMVVRGLRQELGLEPAFCLDLLDPLAIQMVQQGPRTRLAWYYGDSPVSGRCAGPLFSDVRPALPVAVRDPSRRGVFDFRGHSTFSAGPLAGEVDSSLVIQDRPRLAAAAAPRRKRVAEYSLSYRVERGAGAFDTEFRGAADPACRQFDACGLTGRVTHTLDLRGRTLVLTGRLPLPGRRRPPPLRRALREAIRIRSRFSGIVKPSAGGARTVAEVARAGAVTCRDATTGGPAELWVTTHDYGSAFLVPGALNTARTRCPGPDQSDVLGNDDLARAPATTQILPGRKLRLILRARGRFATPGYVGARRGELVLELRRTRVRIRVVRTSRRVIAGDVTGFRGAEDSP
jgi:hypothetical protein